MELVKAIALQKVTAGGKSYQKHEPLELTRQRFESYLSIGAVKAVEECPMPPVATEPVDEVPVVESIPKYLGIEPEAPLLLDRPVHPESIAESPETGAF